MTELQFLSVDRTGDCTFQVKFYLTAAGGVGAVTLADRMKIKIEPKCRKRSFFVSWCSLDEEATANSVTSEAFAYEDTRTTPSTWYYLAIDLDRTLEDDDDCMKLIFRWKCWPVSGVNPVAPYVAEGEADGKVVGPIKLKGKVKVYQLPAWSGDLVFKVCCKKVEIEGETQCKSTCEWVR